ncbi:MAG: hypothetical protein KIT09_29165 [Bryobacteraceae bacterium]|nr:hypothetical protein [Bryobacteraceae bacterium]
MGRTIQADENGALFVPAGLVGRVAPGARFSVEPHGDVVILRREPGEAERWWETTTPAQRVAWLEEWIRGLPASPPLPQGATRRDSMYE